MGFRVTSSTAPRTIAAIKARRGLTWRATTAARAASRAGCRDCQRWARRCRKPTWCMSLCLSAHAELPGSLRRICAMTDRRAASGRTLGAIEFDKVLRDQGCQADYTVAEAGPSSTPAAPTVRRRRASFASKRLFRWLRFRPPARRMLEALDSSLSSVHRRINVCAPASTTSGASFHRR